MQERGGARLRDVARHPHGRADWPLAGIFAQRGKGRFNRIGVMACRLLGVDGLSLRLRRLGAIDGTPMPDVKPAMSGFLPRGALREPGRAKEFMAGHW